MEGSVGSLIDTRQLGPKPYSFDVQNLEVAPKICIQRFLLPFFSLPRPTLQMISDLVELQISVVEFRRLKKVRFPLDLLFTSDKIFAMT